MVAVRLAMDMMPSTGMVASVLVVAPCMVVDRLKTVLWLFEPRVALAS